MNRDTAWKYRLAVAAVLLLALLIRIPHLSADPPSGFTWGTWAFTDEGYYSHNARNQTLFDETETSPYWNGRYVFPVYDLLARAAFSLGGVGFIPLRLISVVFAFFTIWVLALRIPDEPLLEAARPTAAALAAILATWVVFSRVGLVYVPTTFLLAAGVILLIRGTSNPTFLAPSGVALGLALITSSTSALFLPGIVIGWLVAEFRKRNRIARDLLLFAGPFVLTLILFALMFYLPNREEIARNLAISVPPRRLFTTVSRAVLNLAGTFAATPFFSRAPILTLLAIFYVAARVRSREKATTSELIWGGMGLSFLLLIAPVNYRPLRYYLPLILPLCYFGALALSRPGFCWSCGGSRKAFRFFLPSVVAAAALGSRVALVMKNRDASSLHMTFAVVAMVLGVFLVPLALHRFLKLAKNPYQVSLLLAIPVFIFQLSQTLPGLIRPTFSFRDASRELGALLPENSTLLGPFSATLCLENRLHCIPLFEDYRSEDAITKTAGEAGASHLVLSPASNPQALEYDIVRRSRLVKVLDLAGPSIHIYELPTQTSPSDVR